MTDDDTIIITIIDDDDDTPKKNYRKKTTPAPKRTQEAPKNKNKNYGNDRQDKKNAKKIFKNRTGGFFWKSSYEDELKKNGLTITEGGMIRKIVKEEIDNGKLNSESVNARIDYLLSNFKKKRNEYDKNRIRYIDELFESNEIKRQIELWELNESTIGHIKKDLIKKVQTEPSGKYSEEELRTIVEKAIAKERVKKINSKLESYKKEWPTHFKNLIKDYEQDIELTDHEIRYVKIRTENFKNYTSDEQIKRELKLIIPKVLSNRQLIGEYDSAGTLTEDGGVENRGIGSKRRLVKASDKQSDVFIKINEDNFILTETKYKEYFNENPNFRQRTFFFKDLIFINKGIRIPVVSLSGYEKDHYFKPGVEFDLINNEKFKLSFDDLEKIDLFYDKWEYFKKNHSNVVSPSLQESSNSIGEDILKYAELYEKGLLTEEEFTALKKKLLGL